MNVKANDEEIFDFLTSMSAKGETSMRLQVEFMFYVKRLQR